LLARIKARQVHLPMLQGLFSNRIGEYIQSNPARWVEDHLHPDAPSNAFNRWQS